MKRTVICLGVSLFLIGTCLAGENPLLGAWELVGTKSVNTDNTTSEWDLAKDGGRSVKLFTATHFAVVTHMQSGNFGIANAGPCTYTANTFTEHIENSSLPRVIGMEFTHTFKMDGGVMTCTYVNPNTKADHTETWRRVSKNGKDHALIGTWEFVGTKQVLPDGTKREWNVAEDGGRSLKLFTDTHFAVVTHMQDGRFGIASAGHCSVEGNTFTEKVEYTSLPRILGSEFVKTFTIEGDLLVGSGVNPATKVKAEETWRRLK